MLCLLILTKDKKSDCSGSCEECECTLELELTTEPNKTYFCEVTYSRLFNGEVRNHTDIISLDNQTHITKVVRAKFYEEIVTFRVIGNKNYYIQGGLTSLNVKKRNSAILAVHDLNLFSIL